MSDSEESASDDGDAEDRMRDLLASYYGMQDKGEQGAEAGSVSNSTQSQHTKTSNSSQSIDDSSFEPKQYVRQLLKTSPLDVLLRRNDELVHEVKALDSDMQMLVYENYNKFISATDTIRKMKCDVEAMESDMSDLVSRMASVGAKSEVVNGSLSEKRLRIDKLVRVRRLLHRLEFIFDLPAKLNQCIDVGNYSEAVKYYVMSEQVLKNYSHLSSFQTIQADAEDTITRLKSEITKSLADAATTSPTEVIERVGLLLQLKAEPDNLRAALLSSIKAHMASTISEALQKQDDEDEEDGEEVKEDDVKRSRLLKRVSALTTAVAPPLVEHVSAFKKLFQSSNGLEKDLPASDLTRQTASDEAKRQTAKAECDELVDSIASAYFTAARQLFDEEGGTTPDPMAVVETIEALRVVVGASNQLHAMAESVGLIDRSVEVVEYIVRFEIDKGFQWLRDQVVAQLVLKALNKQEEVDVTGNALRNLSQVLKALQPLLDAGNTVTASVDSAHFGALAANNVWMFAAWFGDALESICDVHIKFDVTLINALNSDSTQLSSQVAGMGVPSSSLLTEENDIDPMFVLECAMICTGLCREMLPKCDMVINRCIRDGGVELSGDMELEGHLKKAAHHLTLHFIEVVSGDMAVGVQSVLREERDQEEPVNAVREVFVELMKTIDRTALDMAVTLGVLEKETFKPKAVGNELARVLGFSPNAWTKGNDREMVRKLNASISATSAKGFHLDIERVFSERVVIFSDDVQLSVPSLLFSIFKPLLKAITECIRSSTFRTEESYQQMQLDVQFLRIGVAYFIDGPLENRLVVDALLDEVLISTAERSVMDPADVTMEVKNLVTLSNAAASDIELKSLE